MPVGIDNAIVGHISSACFLCRSLLHCHSETRSDEESRSFTPSRVTIYKCWCSASLSSKYCGVAFGQVAPFFRLSFEEHCDRNLSGRVSHLVEMTFKHLCVTRVFRKQLFHAQFS